MTQTTVYPKHRFYFNVETESNGQQIANELPSYRIACQHIKHYAMESRRSITSDSIDERITDAGLYSSAG